MTDGLGLAKDALTEVEVALRLLRELPPETTGAVLDALRVRVASAVAALDDVSKSAGSVRAV